MSAKFPRGGGGANPFTASRLHIYHKFYHIIILANCNIVYEKSIQFELFGLNAILFNKSQDML